MILLRNFEIANRFFDLHSNSFITTDSKIQSNGWYKLINEIISGLFVLNSNLYILYANEKYLITNNSSIDILDIDNRAFRTCKYYQSGHLIFEFTYEMSYDISKISPFEYIDSEDSDWGSFIFNIVSSNVRKRAIIETLGNVSK